MVTQIKGSNVNIYFFANGILLYILFTACFVYLATPRVTFELHLKPSAGSSSLCCSRTNFTHCKILFSC